MPRQCKFKRKNAKMHICIFYFLVQVYWWRKPEYPEKITGLSQETDNFIT
jgi:hypothetical protein